MNKMNLAFKGGRAEAAAHLYAMKAIDEHKGDDVIDEADEDEGHKDSGEDKGREDG